MEKIAQGHCRETNIAQSEAECYVYYARDHVRVLFFPYCTCGNPLTGLLYW